MTIGKGKRPANQKRTSLSSTGPSNTARHASDDHLWSIEEMCALLPKGANSARAEHTRKLIFKALGEDASADQNHGADECDDDRANHPAARPESQEAEDPPAQNAAKNTQNDVDDSGY
jgi:hypothetical protein